jgi:ribosomal protein S5
VEDQRHRERLEAIRAVTAGMAQAKRNENELYREAARTMQARLDQARMTSGTKVPLYPCDAGTGVPVGNHEFYALPGGVPTCKRCGKQVSL